ncbi:hypothetical protein ES288_A12G206800v1 [Gossypium darwinii]|uniref:Uncharacterized protein n=1 Tax=Gossypium darwinii TaxID=34276 RepID=A0A5D2EBV7_GOSDA|nr:hypothetical protein ES288_A12G206800v1 [Gossypium darwinii]
MNPSLCIVSPSIERKKVSSLLILGLISATCQRHVEASRVVVARMVALLVRIGG